MLLANFRLSLVTGRKTTDINSRQLGLCWAPRGPREDPAEYSDFIHFELIRPAAPSCAALQATQKS